MILVKFQKVKGWLLHTRIALRDGTSELMEVAKDSFTDFEPRERLQISRTGPKARVAVGISIHCTAFHNKNISI